jgi:AAA+ superfamily predicted ATPase
LTAECVCEHLKRPLYIVNGGELGSTPESVEKKLKDLLALSLRWNAIILIDEADVFLEERSAQDIERNSLVSIFLRQLEYFEGMLFLTTNRVSSFDSAFTSRIHLALNYPSLEPNQRLEIWRNSLRRFPIEEVDVDYNCDAMKELSRENLNGRVISYAVRTAKALAEGRDNEGNIPEGQEMGKLKVEHLRDVVNVYKKFSDAVGNGKSVTKQMTNAVPALMA